MKRDNKKEPIESNRESLQIFPNARIYETKLTKKFRERTHWERPNIEEIKAVIPGVVLSLDVEVGERVERGGRVLLFEAMKMHNIVLSPIEGVIKEIHVKEGDKVAKGEVMIYVESLETEEIDNEQLEREKRFNDGDLGLIV